MSTSLGNTDLVHRVRLAKGSGANSRQKVWVHTCLQRGKVGGSPKPELMEPRVEH